MNPSIFPERILSCLQAPDAKSGGTLESVPDGLRSVTTGQIFSFVDGIPSLFQPTDDKEGVTIRIKEFYEKNPFPNYEGQEEFGELVNRGHSNPFQESLLNAIGYNKLILECGCGTGQLSHYLQLNNNQVLGIDMTLNSLKLAMEHKQRNALTRSSFCQMNLFNLAIQDASFDVVISMGVLHHTFDARMAFRHIVRKVKPGGIVIVGLYNYFARVPTWIRSKLVRFLGSKIDFVVRHRIRDARKADIWIQDQYFNPHETWHSIDDVLGWFAENDLEFLNCSPPILDTTGESSEDLFGPSDAGTKEQRVVTQLLWLFSIAREGALFVMIGRKRGG
ncbi:MAG: class I SAM-dependent methyltransferase [Magnetococcales bacterium]|nr:class I SAM-dependent methyltransferase [Magnetococcales bacterium]